MKTPAEQGEIAAACDEAAAYAADHAVEQLYRATHDLDACAPGDEPPVPLPDDGLPLCRFTGWSDRGDPDVGMGPSSGWGLAKDQSGTTLGAMARELAERLSLTPLEVDVLCTVASEALRPVPFIFQTGSQEQCLAALESARNKLMGECLRLEGKAEAAAREHSR
jgi:hypothetical protein